MPCNPNNGLRGYAGHIFPYVKNAQVYVCPSDTTIFTIAAGYSKVSYAGNSNIATTTGNNAPPLISVYAQPARTVLFSEISHPRAVNLLDTQEQDSPASDGQGKAQPNYGSTGTESNATTNPTGETSGRPLTAWQREGRHLEGANYAFIDGHVKWLMGSSVSTGRTQTRANCNQDNSPAVAGSPGCNGAANTAAGTSGLMNGQTPAATFGVF
jgi:prepilin-type processing-associated H-X9-DG protein